MENKDTPVVPDIKLITIDRWTYTAVDRNGLVYAYMSKPVTMTDQWSSNGGDWCIKIAAIRNLDIIKPEGWWRESLRVLDSNCNLNSISVEYITGLFGLHPVDIPHIHGYHVPDLGVSDNPKVRYVSESDGSGLISVDRHRPSKDEV